MADNCSPTLDLICAILDEEDPTKLAHYETLLEQLECAKMNAFSCPFPMKTQIKGFRFETRKEFIEAVMTCIRYVKEQIYELEGSVYLRVNTGPLGQPLCPYWSRWYE